MSLDDLSSQIISDFESSNVQARNILKVFLCGSHKGEDKKHLEDLRDEIRHELKVPGTFTMEDIKTRVEMGLHQKFELVWNRIRAGDNVPLCILCAGETAGESTGLSVEIQNVAKDPEKKKHTHLIVHKDVKLTHYAREFPPFIVTDIDGLKRVAKRIVNAKINETESFLIRGRGKNGT